MKTGIVGLISHNEGIARVLMGAMARGKFVLAPRYSGETGHGGRFKPWPPRRGTQVLMGPGGPQPPDRFLRPLAHTA